jgi:rsbT co-antagonist protein RsbR
VVVLDITGVPDVDEKVADHLAGSIGASRLMGAAVIITGLSAEIAQTLVAIGADISKLNTAGAPPSVSLTPCGGPKRSAW